MKDKLQAWLHDPWQYVPVAVYVSITLAIMAPLLLPGYILTLDMVFVPHPPLPTELSSSYLYHALLHFASYILPSDALQKIILCLIIFMAGYGAHRLAWRLRPAGANEVWLLVPFVAGLLYVINPFVYARFMAGQYAVLLGYALLPWVVRALLQFCQRPSWRTSLPVILWTLAISIVSVHTLGPVIIFALVIGVTISWKRRHDHAALTQIIKYGAVITASLILLCSYWLVPAITGHGPIADASESYNQTQANAFATWGGLLNVLQLHGFWAEPLNLFIATDQPLPLSGLWQLLLWALIVIGIVAAWRRQKLIACIFLASSSVAALLALGVFQNLLVAAVPLFGGYREPHKFAMVVALTNTYFAGWGTYALLAKFHGRRPVQAPIAAAIIVLPLLVTPTLLWGLNGQLQARDYPRDWYAIDARLRDAGNQKILFLPWHLYMRYSFAGGRIVAAPAQTFFAGRSLVTSDDPEFAGVWPLARDNTKSRIAQLINDRQLTTEKLRQLGIGYILLAREADAEDYEYIVRQPGIEQVEQLPALALYKVAAP